jgi:ParB-like chromosome segregation protein Spo0J
MTSHGTRRSPPTYRVSNGSPNRKPTVRWPVEMVPLPGLRPAQRNARTHSNKQIRQIAESMRRFGVINPLIVDDRGHIVAGHARAEAGKLLGLKQVPVIRISHLNEAEIRAYMLADNKLAEKAGWDREALALEFEDLQVALPEFGLDLRITGFDPAEIDSIIADFGDVEGNPADEIPEVADTVVARTGDLYVLGQHRLVVGDARDPRVYERVMRSERATMAFLDPPYNAGEDREGLSRGMAGQQSGLPSSENHRKGVRREMSGGRSRCLAEHAGSGSDARCSRSKGSGARCSGSHGSCAGRSGSRTNSSSRGQTFSGSCDTAHGRRSVPDRSPGEIPLSGGPRRLGKYHFKDLSLRRSQELRRYKVRCLHV